MELLNALLDSGNGKPNITPIQGVVIGIVTNNQDPEKLGRVKVKFPWLSQADESAWARIAAPMAGNNRGAYFLPEVDDEVLVTFERGDLRFPYILGALWNGKDAPPEKNEDGGNHVRSIVSRSGHVIRLNDEDGKEKIEIIDKTKKNSIIFDTANNTIQITTDKDIKLSAPQGAIELNAKTISIKSSADTKIEAQNLEIKSSADTKIEATAISIKSSASTKIEASAGMDLNANATMNLKGGTINLN
jgi:uncharacterized protein involved in type VI secretion and phage assembly